MVGVVIVVIVIGAGAYFAFYSKTSGSTATTLCSGSTETGSSTTIVLCGVSTFSASSATVSIATTGPLVSEGTTGPSLTTGGPPTTSSSPNEEYGTYEAEVSETFAESGTQGYSTAYNQTTNGFIVLHVYPNGTVTGGSGIGTISVSGTTTTQNSNCKTQGGGSFSFTAMGSYEAQVGNITVAFLNFNPTTVPGTWSCINSQGGSTTEQLQIPADLYPPALVIKLAGSDEVNGSAPCSNGGASCTVSWTWKLTFCPGGLCPVNP